MIYRFTQLMETMKYKDLKNCDYKNVFHWGQLKLLLSEILFLAKESTGKPMNVIYVGAAEGYHISKLADLFPEHKYDLYDKRKFILEPRDNITLHNEYYTEEHAKKDKKNGDNILFISDIRSLEIGEIRENIEETDKLILGDLELQKIWVSTIRPKASLLKFRLPYDTGKTKYFKGITYLQQFGPYSTELRLLVKDYDKFRLYDNQMHEEKMAYFNCRIRPEENKKWAILLKKLDLHNNLDTAMMLEIIKYYLIKKNKQTDDFTISKLCMDMLNYLKGMSYGKFKNIFINKKI